MTKDRDFKRLVRERAEETGETYTAARAALRQDDPLTDEALAKFRERFFAIRDNIENSAQPAFTFRIHWDATVQLEAGSRSAFAIT